MRNKNTTRHRPCVANVGAPLRRDPSDQANREGRGRTLGGFATSAPSYFSETLRASFESKLSGKDSLAEMSAGGVASAADDEVADELASLSAIFGADELAVDADDDADSAARTLRFALPGGLRVVVRLPRGYPTAAEPDVEVSGLPRGRAGARLEAALAAVVERARGAPCVYDLVQCARDFAQEAEGRRGGGGDDGRGADAADEAAASAEAVAAEVAFAASCAAAEASGEAGDAVAFVHGEPLVERKSVFVAHAVPVHSADDVRAALAVLLAEPRIARATHNIRAWRFRDASGALHADNDDDGEDAAGGRLAEMLSLMGAEGVLVVVTRWFGGVLLGPARFKCINNSARSLLETLPWSLPSTKVPKGKR
jgi:hypothetical protein